MSPQRRPSPRPPGAASGDDPLYVSEQMGHKDVRFTLHVYSKAVKRRAKLSGVYLTEFEKTLCVGRSADD